MIYISNLFTYLLKFYDFNSDSDGILEILNAKLSRINPLYLIGLFWHGGF